MRFILFTAMLLAALLTGASAFVMPAPWRWICAGAGAAMILLLAVLYRRTVSPLAVLETGVSLLRGQDFSSRLTRVGQKDADSIGATFNLMMDALRSERTHAMEQNRFLDQLIDASPSGIVIFDLDGPVRSANPAAKAFLGCDSPEGKRLGEIGTDIADACASLAEGATATFRLSDTRIFRASSRTFVDRGFQRRFLLLESLADEIRRVEKDAYGKVIRMMAHEVNNTVAGASAILDNIELVVDDPDMAESIAACRERFGSVSRFITGYADMVKIPAPDRRVFDLNGLLRRLLPFVESLATGRDIAFTLRLCDGPLPVDADPVQIEQVVVNVCKNAVESIGTRGTVTIITDGDGLTVADDGPGIAPDVAPKLFSPFFSTKSGGRGLGLMCVGEILRNHGFTFSLRTCPDGLTRFTIRL